MAPWTCGPLSVLGACLGKLGSLVVKGTPAQGLGSGPLQGSISGQLVTPA